MPESPLKGNPFLGQIPSQSTTSTVKDLGHLLEPALAVLAQLSHPSSLADAGPVEAFPREAALVARLGRGGVSEQDEVEQNIDQQVPADSPRVAVGGRFGSEHEKCSLIFPFRIHCPQLLFFPGPNSSSNKPRSRPGPWGLTPHRASTTWDAFATTKKLHFFSSFMPKRLRKRLKNTNASRLACVEFKW